MSRNVAIRRQQQHQFIHKLLPKDNGRHFSILVLSKISDLGSLPPIVCLILDIIDASQVNLSWSCGACFLGRYISVKKVIFTNVVFRIFEDLVRKVNKQKNLIAKTLIALGYLGRQ